MLGQLSTGELQPTTIERTDRPRTNFAEINSAQLEIVINKLEAKGENLKGRVLYPAMMHSSSN